LAGANIGDAFFQRMKISVTKDGAEEDWDGELSIGDLTIGEVEISGSLPAGDNNIGNVDIASAIPAGTNNIGDVDVLTLPSLPAGVNNIGDVDVLTLPALPAGTNAIGKLAANSGVDIGDVDVLSLPSLPSGTNNIGDVDVLTLPVLPAGTNTIGAVIGPAVSVASAISGLITVTTAGTAVQGGNVALTNGVFVKAHPDNTDTVWVGNDGAGDVAATNGYPLDAGEFIVIQVDNLSDLWFDADVNGEKICWLKG
jgi:hypothetical protein